MANSNNEEAGTIVTVIGASTVRRLSDDSRSRRRSREIGRKAQGPGREA